VDAASLKARTRRQDATDLSGTTSARRTRNNNSKALRAVRSSGNGKYCFRQQRGFYYRNLLSNPSSKADTRTKPVLSTLNPGVYVRINKARNAECLVLSRVLGSW
jgi:hypothetical protein